METIQIANIKIPENRIRREFGDKKLEELKKSILDKGLLHPIVLENDGKTLACGERRLRAVTMLASEGLVYYCDGRAIPPGMVAFTTMQNLDPIKRREAELEENVCRQDLTVQEYSLTIAELHKLRVGQHGDYDIATKTGWSKADTAEEVRGNRIKRGIAEVNEALLIAENLDDPFVAAASTKAEALRAVRDRKKLETRQAKTKTFDATQTEHSLIIGDSFQLIETLHLENSYDIILTDPPYGMELHKTSMFDDNIHDYDDSDEMFNRICNELPGLARTAAKAQAHCYVFCDIRRFNELFTAFELSGWTCWQRPLIWHKGNIGSFGAGEFGFRQTYDAILFANKGKKPLNSVYDEVIRVNQPTNHAHPAGKPPELYAELLRRSSVPGDRVIDFFCGSGPIFPAAQKLKCVATGIELNEKYHEMSMETLMGIKK